MIKKIFIKKRNVLLICFLTFTVILKKKTKEIIIHSLLNVNIVPLKLTFHKLSHIEIAKI